MGIQGGCEEPSQLEGAGQPSSCAKLIPAALLSRDGFSGFNHRFMGFLAWCRLFCPTGEGLTCSSAASRPTQPLSMCACSVWWDDPAHPFSLSQAELCCHSRESHPPHPSRCSHPRISLVSFPRNQHNLLAFSSSSPSSDRNTPSSLHLWQDYLF